MQQLFFIFGFLLSSSAFAAPTPLQYLIEAKLTVNDDIITQPKIMVLEGRTASIQQESKAKRGRNDLTRLNVRVNKVQDQDDVTIVADVKFRSKKYNIDFEAKPSLSLVPGKSTKLILEDKAKQKIKLDIKVSTI